MKNVDFKKLLVPATAGLIVLSFIIAFAVNYFTAEERKWVRLPIDSESSIVTDNTYVYYTSPEGNIMRVSPYDTKPMVWAENQRVLYADEKNIIVADGDKTHVLYFEGTDPGETYDFVSDNVQLNDKAIFYKDMETGFINFIYRDTREEVVFIQTKIKKFEIKGDEIIYAPDIKNSGIVKGKLDGSVASLYAPERTVVDLMLGDNNYLYYVDGNNKNQVMCFKFYSDMESEIKGKRFSKICFCKGAYFGMEKTAFGGSRLVIDVKEAY